MKGPQTYRMANNALTDDSHIHNELKNTYPPDFDVKKLFSSAKFSWMYLKMVNYVIINTC